MYSADRCPVCLHLNFVYFRWHMTHITVHNLNSSANHLIGTLLGSTVYPVLERYFCDSFKWLNSNTSISWSWQTTHPDEFINTIFVTKRRILPCDLVRARLHSLHLDL